MRKFVMVGVGCAALALGACSTGRTSTGSLWAQPGKYDFLKCPDLVRLTAASTAREKELVGLMERANQDTAGPVVNLLVYRSDLEQVRADLELLQATAQQKGCDLTQPPPKK